MSVPTKCICISIRFIALQSSLMTRATPRSLRRNSNYLGFAYSKSPCFTWDSHTFPNPPTKVSKRRNSWWWEILPCMGNNKKLICHSCSATKAVRAERSGMVSKAPRRFCLFRNSENKSIQTSLCFQTAWQTESNVKAGREQFEQSSILPCRCRCRCRCRRRLLQLWLSSRVASSIFVPCNKSTLQKWIPR